MLNYSLYTIKNNIAKNKFIYNQWKRSLERFMTTSKIDDVIFLGGAHTHRNISENKS